MNTVSCPGCGVLINTDIAKKEKLFDREEMEWVSTGKIRCPVCEYPISDYPDIRYAIMGL